MTVTHCRKGTVNPLMVYGKFYSSFSIHNSSFSAKSWTALTYNESQSLNVNTGRILPGFGRKLRITEKLDCQGRK